MASLIAISCTATALDIRAQTPALTLTNPTPSFADSFGQKVAVIGDSWLIGDPQDSTIAQYSGAVYLYGSNGALMRTFLNPAPVNGYFFGYSMAAVGNDRVLIGAPFGESPPSPNPGAAYLFHTNGTLIRTFLRPPSQAAAGFGVSVAALGPDRVAIGADRDDRAGTDSGAVYLFRTNGTLLATITNPAPVNSEYFGRALTVLGTDRLLIGTGGTIFTVGSAYLFNTNGTMLTKFNNPIPASGGTFGHSVAALGADLVAISAPYANITAPGGGVVYLFRTNGVLFGPALENPDVAENDNFGIAIAAVGADKVLVGSFNQAAEQYAGAAYLFGTNGSLLMTMRNPTPGNPGFFGTALAMVNANRVLIGSHATDPAGAAYVYDLRPAVSISKTATNTVVVSWPSPWKDWALQQNSDLNPSSWTTPSETRTDNGTNKFITVKVSTDNRFFRLVRP